MGGDPTAGHPKERDPQPCSCFPPFSPCTPAPGRGQRAASPTSPHGATPDPHPSIFRVPAPPLQPPRRPRWLLRPRSLWHGVASVPSVPRGLTLAAGPVAAFWAVRPVGSPFAPRTPHWGRRRHPLGPTGRHRANWYHGSVKHSPVPAPQESCGDTGGGWNEAGGRRRVLHGVVLSRGGDSGGLRCQLGSPAGWCWIPRAPSLVWVPLGAPFFWGEPSGGGSAGSWGGSWGLEVLGAPPRGL